MTFEEILDQAIAMLQRRGRVTYRLLQRQFQLDDDTLGDLLAELRYAHREAISEDEQGMVWTGAAAVLPTPPPPALQPFQPSVSQEAPAPQADGTPTPPQASDAERRQVTVLFCDLVDSTRLASELDPEDLRAVVRAYQDTCAKVIARFEGHIAQYLGDGLLVYFGYPLAHEDDAQRGVRAGLGIVDALGQLNARLTQERGVQLAVRLGIHTGLVVVGDMGGGTRQEQLALGETPNLAARLQGIAAPNTLVISATTFQLLGGFFACQPLGTPPLKGQAQPLAVYRVLYESMARSRLEATGSTGWTPLVGREQEIGLLVERWTQVKEGVGQVVLLSGEAGIGKSRLVQVLQEHVSAEPQAWLTPCQCSPYHQHTALYPLIDLLERVVLRFEREESPQQKLRKLEGFLVQYGLPLAETMPLFATLLSLPLGADYAPLPLSPEQQKQKTLQTLLTVLLRFAAQQPVLFVMEDLHWVDPTTLEFLILLVDQGPTARILTLFTFRPDFSPPWTGRSHLTQVTLPRLTRRQAAELTGRVAHGKALPAEVIEQVVAKTDGVPLFVEELTKMVLESGLLQEGAERYELTGPLPPLAIPATLHDSLMARLDRLAAVKAMAQLGATLGREFSYELLHAVSPCDEGTLQRGLQQLVEAEFLYQRGLPPQVTYLSLQRRLNIDTLTFSWYLFLYTHNSTRRQKMLPACRTADETFAIPQFALTRSDIDSFMEELRGFHTAFRDCFVRQEPREQFFNYMVGQFSPLERKSIEPMALQVEGGNVRAMQRLVSDALWDEAAMLETYHHLVQDEMGEPDGVLIVDETGFAKKGQDSVGVARQYCGALGKVENCQVGVFAAYASRQGYALVDKRLFLPEAWFADAYQARRTKCKMPDEVAWQSKPQLAAAMVQALHQAGILPFKYIVADCLYGNSPDFWTACEACVGTVAFVATPADTRCWLQPLATTTHTYTSKGEQRTKRVAVTDTPPSTVAALAHALPTTFWYRRTVSEGTKGPITYEFARKRIMLCKDGSPTTAVWLLIKRTLGAHLQYWYYLSNAPLSTPLRLFVWLSGVRWAIEQCFEETKTELGMDHYEVRKYPGWHHHMLTCMLAHFFLWHLQIRLEKKAPAHTVSQVRRLLAVVLPLKVFHADEVLQLIAGMQQRQHRAYLSHRKRRLHEIPH